MMYHNRYSNRGILLIVCVHLESEYPFSDTAIFIVWPHEFGPKDCTNYICINYVYVEQ